MATTALLYAEGGTGKTLLATLPQPIENEQAELEPSVQTNWSKSSAQESQLQAQARDWILLLDLTEMESLHLWLGELIQSLSLGE